jgi:hypothetical protein
MEQSTERRFSQISNPQSPILDQKSKRPFSVTLVALAVLTIAVVHLVRLVNAIRQWDFLVSLLDGLVIYQALTGLVWTLAGLPLAWGLWRGLRWAPNAVRIILPAYLLYAWIDRMLVASPAIAMQSNSSWPFMAGATLVALILIYWIFTRSKTVAFFRRDS